MLNRAVKINIPEEYREISGHVQDFTFRELQLDKATGREKTIGQTIIDSEMWKDCHKGITDGRSLRFEFPEEETLGRGGFSTRATITESGLTSIQKQPSVVTLGQQDACVGDLFYQGETQAATVRYISENSYTNAATPVAENAAVPEATFDVVETDAPCRKIAVMSRASGELLEDFAAVRSYIDQRLSFMVRTKEDSELLNGDGIAPRLKGLLNFSGVQTQAAGGDIAADAIQKGITKVMSLPGYIGLKVDGICCHPLDYKNLVLSKDKNGAYMFGGPGGSQYGNPASAPSIWSIQPIVTSVISQGTFLVGAFKFGACRFRRRGLVIEFTNSDASDFANDRILIRASTRVALAVYSPLAFCQVTGIS